MDRPGIDNQEKIQNTRNVRIMLRMIPVIRTPWYTLYFGTLQLHCVYTYLKQETNVCETIWTFKTSFGCKKKPNQHELPRNIATDVLKMFYENIQL